MRIKERPSVDLDSQLKRPRLGQETRVGQRYAKRQATDSVSLDQVGTEATENAKYESQ